MPGIPLVPFLVLSSYIRNKLPGGKTKKEEIVSVPEVTGEERTKENSSSHGNP